MLVNGLHVYQVKTIKLDHECNTQLATRLHEAYLCFGWHLKSYVLTHMTRSSRETIALQLWHFIIYLFTQKIIWKIMESILSIKYNTEITHCTLAGKTPHSSSSTCLAKRRKNLSIWLYWMLMTWYFAVINSNWCNKTRTYAALHILRVIGASCWWLSANIRLLTDLSVLRRNLYWPTFYYVLLFYYLPFLLCKGREFYLYFIRGG